MSSPRTSVTLRVARSLASLALLSMLGAAGCSDSSTSPDDTNNGTVALTGKHYIQAKIDGTVVTVQDDGVAGTGIAYSGSGGGGNNPDYYLEAQTIHFVKVILVGNRPEQDPTFRSPMITFVHNYYDQPFGAEHDSVIKRGSNPFGSEEKEIDGVEILWTDASGTQWSSSKGTGDQTGSNFVVTEHTLQEYQIGQYKAGRYYSKGTFSAKLYDGTGRSINVTDGKFALQTVWGW
jgi:hypothetical protein